MDVVDEDVEEYEEDEGDDGAWEEEQSGSSSGQSKVAPRLSVWALSFADWGCSKAWEESARPGEPLKTQLFLRDEQAGGLQEVWLRSVIACVTWCVWIPNAVASLAADAAVWYDAFFFLWSQRNKINAV
jgi:hypothetical protein